MPCFSPLVGYRGRTVSQVTGKRSVVFNPREGFGDLPVSIPCGQCVGCRLERSRQWAIRCMHEASLYAENCFVTLTYDDEHLPPGGGLDRGAFPKFMKRLRKRFGKVRYYHAGEYGDKFGRPHYHACLFGFDFPDKVFWMRRGEFPVWQAGSLGELWPFGRSEIGSVTFESAAYVARYIMKKLNGKLGEEHYERVDGRTGEVVSVEREYTTMSRRPGIGRPWLDRYGSEVYPADSVVVRGRLMKPPRFYDMQHELASPDEAAAVFEARRRKRNRADETIERLEVRQLVAEAKLNLKRRDVE